MQGVNSRGLSLALAGALAVGLLAACGSSGSTGAAGSASGSAASGGKTEISLLVASAAPIPDQAKAVVAAFEKANPDITVKINLSPGGSEGDNLAKTKLSTGNMEDVFWYNSGSLLQALKPAQSLVDLTNDPVLKDVDAQFLPVVTVDGKVYGAPVGTVGGGGILYNKEVFAKLGLSVPKTWAEFTANNDKMKAAGVIPLVGTFKDTWTTQIILLADYHNVAAGEPDWASQYTENKVKYESDPLALRGFEKLADVASKGWLNKGAGSSVLTQGMTLLGSGKAGQYPMLGFAVAQLPPDQAKNIGIFGIPGDDPSKAGLTVWMPNGQYIPKSSKHIDAAKKFVAFTASPAGTEAFSSAAPVGGPYPIKGSTVPADALPIVKDVQAYLDAKATTPALEFLSPIKGPALEQITTSVLSGQTSAKEAAAQYDADVVKQAKQLGLPGW